MAEAVGLADSPEKNSVASAGDSPPAMSLPLTSSLLWIEFFDADGDPYYFQPVTEETTRDLPTGDGIQLIGEEAYMLAVNAQNAGGSAATSGQTSGAESRRSSVSSAASTGNGIDDWGEFTADDGTLYVTRGPSSKETFRFLVRWCTCPLRLHLILTVVYTYRLACMQQMPSLHLVREVL